MHFNAARLLVKYRPVFKAIDGKIPIQFGVDAAQQVIIKRGGYTGFVIVSRFEDFAVFAYKSTPINRPSPLAHIQGKVTEQFLRR